MSLEKDNSQDIREVVQEVLADVLNSLSEGVSPVEKFKENETEVETEPTENKTEESTTESVKDEAVVSCMTEPITDQNITAVPTTQVVDSNLGVPEVTPTVNNLPTTNDIYQTVGNPDTVPEVPCCTAENIVPEEPVDETVVEPNIVVEPDYVPTAEIKTVSSIDTDPATNEVVENKSPVVNINGNISFTAFGVEVNCTKNEDGSCNVVLTKNGVTRVETLPSSDNFMPIMYLVENFVDSLKTEQEEIAYETEKITIPAPVIEENLEENNLIPEAETSRILSPAIMSSLRKKYASKVFEIFDLGLQTKNAILAESRNKLFSKTKKEYEAKNSLLSKKLKVRKDELNSLISKYVEIRKNRENISKMTSILSSIVNESKTALTEKTFNESNANKVFSTIQSIISKVVKSSETNNFGTVLASAINQFDRVKALVSKEIDRNKKALVADTRKRSRKVLESDEERNFKYIGMTASKKPAPLIPIERDFKYDSEDFEDDYDEVSLLSSSLTRPSRGLAHRVPSRVSNVVVESSYVGRPRDTISKQSRHDGMDEMIGEIGALALGISEEF